MQFKFTDEPWEIVKTDCTYEIVSKKKNKGLQRTVIVGETLLKGQEGGYNLRLLYLSKDMAHLLRQLVYPDYSEDDRRVLIMKANEILKQLT